MGITVEQVITIDGQRFKFNPARDATDNVCKFICDSPRCASRHEGKTTFLTWTEETARADIFALSDDYTGLIRISPNPWNVDEVVMVCSAQCGKDYLTYAYARPKTPRQLKQEADEKLKVSPIAQKAIEEQSIQMKLPFDEVEGPEIVTVASQLSDSDATGYKESE